MRALLLLLVLLPLAAPTVPAEAVECVTFPDGAVACGEVTLGPCGAGTANGQATRSVTWWLVVEQNGFSWAEGLAGPTFSASWSGDCRGTACTAASLYADGRLVSQARVNC